jgi:hypothetical protein
MMKQMVLKIVQIMLIKSLNSELLTGLLHRKKSDAKHKVENNNIYLF